MFDVRPAGYVIGLLIVALGATMAFPMTLEMFDGNGHWRVFAVSGFLTCLIGGAISLTCQNATREGLTIQQTFLLTTGVWLVLPLFAAFPFYFGPNGVSLVDAIFEATSGLTTTGATVLTGLQDMPRGILLWRGLTQWFGGIGIIVVAMVFLPLLRVGGMQIFKTEAFDTMGKILPKAAEIAKQISVIYFTLTAVCGFFYVVAGMQPFDAIVHAMTTIATGGFANHDGSFGVYHGASEWVGVVFMLLASLPFVRYVQLLAGSAQPLWRDSQIRTFFGIAIVVMSLLVAYRFVTQSVFDLDGLRDVMFNVTSILTGTGYASTDYQLWGNFPVVLFFLIGLIGGCAGSTCCSIKVFRYQLLWGAIMAQIKRLHSPNGIFPLRYEHRRVSEDVISSVMAFFMMFMLSLAVVSVLLGMTGLDMVTSISGAASALANIGPGLGSEIGPSGNFAGLNVSAKWILVVAMLLGRLELMAVYVLFTWSFWRG